MKIEYVKELPKHTRRRRGTKWTVILDEFAASEERIMKLTPDADEYKSSLSMYSSVAKAAKRYSSSIHAVRVNGENYLVKAD